MLWSSSGQDGGGLEFAGTLPKKETQFPHGIETKQRSHTSGLLSVYVLKEAGWETRDPTFYC